MYGGASGKSGGKTNSASNIPPSHTVSDGPKIVAVHTHVLSSAGPIDADAGNDLPPPSVVARDSFSRIFEIRT